MNKPKLSEKYLKTGHAPGHIRECLIEALIDHNGDWWQNLEMDFMRERHQAWWDQASHAEQAYWLIGQLWNCTDIVPSLVTHAVSNWLETDREPTTFARLVRVLKADLDATLRSVAA